MQNFALIVNIMLYVSKIDEYLKLLTDEEVKDFVVIILVNSLNLQEKSKVLEKFLNYFLNFF